MSLIVLAAKVYAALFLLGVALSVIVLLGCVYGIIWYGKR